MTPNEILDLPLQDSDVGATTVRGYLVSLLAALWDEREGFSGKRPLGDSGWEFYLYAALVQAGAIDGTYDEDGYPERLDTTAGDRIISEAIAALGWTE